MSGLQKKEHISSEREKKLFLRIAHALFDSNRIIYNSKPIKSSIKLIKKLKKKSHHKLFLLSNADRQTFAILVKHYADFFSLFDGIVISANVNQVKPYPEIYHHLLNTYNLDPQTCVFIDDQEENIKTAKQLGIHGIIYTKTPMAEKELKQLGVL